MHKSNKLYSLIRSMSKSEKKAFRLFAERIQTNNDLLYLQLFDLMIKQKTLNEDLLKKELSIDRINYANLKRHLYQQILTSLRLVKKSKSPVIKVREMIDFAYILYDKGLYLDALKMIEKTKSLATKHHFDFLKLLITEVEKMIHSRHITRSKSKPINELIASSSKQISSLSNRVKLSNLRLALHKFYIERGHVKNKEEADEIQLFFNKNLPLVNLVTCGMMEKIHLYQSYVWYYYIMSDFKACHDKSLLWISTLRDKKELLSRDYTLYLRGYHYLLTSVLHLKDIDKYMKYHQELEDFRHDNYQRFDHNTKIVSFLYVYTARLNKHILLKTYHEGILHIPKTLARLNRYGSRIDTHKVMLFYYKFAWLLLRNDQANDAIPYLQWILNLTRHSLRTDIQVYTRLMMLMCHYNLQQYDNVMTLARQYTRFLDQSDLESQVPISFLNFFKKIIKVTEDDRIIIITDNLQAMKKMKNNTYEKKAFLHLDIIDWLSDL